MDTHVIREEFRSFDQLLTTLAARPNNKYMKGENDSEKNSKKFTGTSSYKQACEMLATGYLEILGKISKNIATQNKINAKFVQAIDRPRPQTGVCGYVPCVPNAIRNIPQSMIGVDRKPIKRKTLHILYAFGGNCEQTTDWFINAGGALLSAIDIIEKGGVQTKIDLCFFPAERSGEITFPVICIKNYGERYSMQKISFPLAHPSMFRRIGFKWLETSPDITTKFYNYGHAPSYEMLEEALEIKDPATYLISTQWINQNNCSVEKILKKFEVI